MSEAKDLLDRFWHGQSVEYESSHQQPTVCLMGHVDFEAFRFLMKGLFKTHVLVEASIPKDGHPLISENFERTICFQGIRIFCSYANETGMVFGGPERE